MNMWNPTLEELNEIIKKTGGSLDLRGTGITSASLSA